MIVEELQAVALTDEIAVAVVAEGDVILFGSATACIVREGRAVVRLERSATLPDSRLSAVGGRIAACLSIPHTTLLKKLRTWQSFELIQVRRKNFMNLPRNYLQRLSTQ